MTDEEVQKNVARGTTTRPEHLQVLYNDGRIALVKRPGGKVGRSGFQHWIPARVDRFDLVRPDMAGGVWNGYLVWECRADRRLPLTRKRLTALVELLGLNPACIRTERAIKPSTTG